MGSLKESVGKDNVKIFNEVSKLVDTVREKLEDKSTNTDDEKVLFLKDLKEFEELKELCNNEDPLLSLTACQGLVSLVQSNSISLKYAFIVLQGILVGKKNIRGVTSAVFNILVLDLRVQLQEGSTYKNPLPSHKQHPLCRLLVQNPNSWRDIFNQMSSICYNHNKLVSDHALELLKPLFKFILVESSDAFSESCRHQIWKLLVEKAIVSDKEFIFQILFSRYFYAGMRDPLEVVDDISLLSHALKDDEHLNTALIPVVASLVHDIIKSCYDPSSVLNQLKVLLDTPDNSMHTVVLIMLSQSVTICPAVFLRQILDFCEWLVSKGQCSADSIWMLVVASISWLNCVSPILAPAHQSIKNILAVAQTAIASPNNAKVIIENQFMPFVVSNNQQISLAIQLTRLCELLRMDDETPMKWLSSIPSDMISDVYLLIGALMIGREEPKIRLKAVDVIKDAPSSFASRNLTLILYQLGREKEPDGQLALLRALVATATDRSNIASIIFTLKTLQKSNEPHLQMLSVDLYLRLWNIEQRCYPFLLTALTEEREQFTDAKFSRQMDIACAAGFRYICDKMPEKHGKELVKPIQDLLIKCQGTKGAIASSFLIQALASLVKARVLSASSTWKQLYPLTEDMQSAVCASFCLLTEACLQNPCEEDVINSMCAWLWKLVSTYKATFVVDAALRALKNFSVESMKLRLIPANYRRNVVMPSKYAKNPASADRRPEDVVEFVPGSVWVEFLQNVRSECKDSACKLLTHWLEMELVKYRGGVYNVTYGEPKNYDKLPDYSICRGLVDHLRRLSDSVTPETDVKLQKVIFEVLCCDRPKPLPPIDWNFLLPYIKHPDLKNHALMLAAKEAKGSLSARACIESYINEDCRNEEDDLFLYSLLSDLARGVPPKTLQNLIGRTLQKAFVKKDDESMKLYLKHIAKTLSEMDIHEANRTLFTQVLKAMWEDLMPNSSIMEDVINCIVNLPISQIESMSSVSVMWEVTPERLRKAISLRCEMGLTDNSETPFTWLNECIENAAGRINEQQYLLTEIEKVLEKKLGHETAWPWLEELIGQMLQTAYNNEPGLDFIVSVFLLSVDYISKFSCLFLKENVKGRLFRFPHAFHYLISRRNADLKKVKGQIKYLSESSALSKEHASILQFGMSALSCWN